MANGNMRAIIDGVLAERDHFNRLNLLDMLWIRCYLKVQNLVELFGTSQYLVGVWFRNFLKNFSVEMPEQVIADITKCQSITSFETYIKSLIIYWQGKHKGQTNLLSVKEIDLIRKKIRPNVDFLPKFSLGLSSLRNQINQYTEEQFEVVDSAQQNGQLIVEGGAGTGKTYVAIQWARAVAIRGLKVLL